MAEQSFERNLGFLLGDIARLTRISFDRRVLSLGLTRSQWWVLTYALREPGLTQSALAEHLEIGKVALGNLVDRLEAKGWVERRPDPRDRRIKRVYLTEAVKPIIDSMREPAEALFETTVSGLSKDERETLIELLLVVKGNLVEDVARRRG